MGTLSVASSSLLRVRAAWDTQQRLPYNRNAPRDPNPKPKNFDLLPTTTVGTTPSVTLSAQTVSELLKRNTNGQVQNDDLYMGYERWLPSPPKVEKPRSVFNAATLAYIGDSIYELYARRHFLSPPLKIDDYNDRVTAVVRCEAQDALLQKLVSENFLTAEERDVLRWGRNVGSAKSRTKKRAGVAVYNRASSLETLIGYLYLTNKDRLEEMMIQMGFSTGISEQMILDEANVFAAKG
ncbi:hypothetical protein K2173_024506 [Erythroxylum novogranatense]|uniref:RNase III domain-containing protein n=1 Tax=Erythroxylum novogranatense TaxID=1862640 RepID=A0AAV8SUI0_9ROSI|nr:hypothetical protein K2173_024506 [Erythroxylum novogranatense]